MARRRQPKPTTGDLHRAPIITDQLIIREATRRDAQALEETMDASGLDEGDRTTDGARRFDAGHSEAPVWTATRAVCEKGSARIVGGLVLTEVADPEADVRRIGFWLEPGAERYAAQLIAAADQRLRAEGADRVLIHVRADDEPAQRNAEAAGFRRSEAVRHTTSAGRELDFWEYVRP